MGFVFVVRNTEAGWDVQPFSLDDDRIALIVDIALGNVPPAPTPPGILFNIRTTINGLRVRSGPGVGFSQVKNPDGSLMFLNNNMVKSVYEINGTWYRIDAIQPFWIINQYTERV